MKTNIPIQYDKAGHELKGRVIFLHPHEIRVTIDEPFDHVTAGRHTFFNAGDNPERSFTREGQLSPAGEETAIELLKLIYDASLMIRAHEQELRREYAPVQERLKSLYNNFRSTVPEFPTSQSQKSDELVRQHLDTLQSILYLNHEYYKNVCSSYPDFTRVGLDTFMELTDRFLT